MVNKLIYFLFLTFLFSSGYSQYYEIEDNKYIRLTEKGVEYYSKNLPNVVDILNSPYFPPIYRQEHWVCNQVSSSYYMFTYEKNKRLGIDSSQEENQYAIYFPWNFGNGGSGWYGDSYILTMEMMKSQGIPKKHLSPADQSKDSALWASGYDFYYELMHNKVLDYYTIDVSTEEGILALKGWIYNYLGSDYYPAYGGSATFMANSAVGGTGFLPEGTPHAGAYVYTKCGDKARHARTIIGYNDHIKYDYNGDGQYTNDVDLNGDGIIDARDWEIGGFRIVESYGPDWQGDGTCYFMYKTFADRYTEGGILNNYVHVLLPNIDYKPKLTAKIELKHERRRRIKVKIGINPDTTANEPEYIKDFPFFNYQGGDQFMQGGTEEIHKSIEFGLDITPLLKYFNQDNYAKLFLIVDEYDPHDQYPGEILNFAIRDYSGEYPVEYNYGEAVELENHSATSISVVVNCNSINRPVILTEQLPMLSSNTYNYYQLEFEGGTPPYNWEILPYFEKTEEFYAFNSFDGTKLTPDEHFQDELILNIPFDFPFHNFTTDKLKVHTRGYILPHRDKFSFTQFREHLFPFFINENMIAPLARFRMENNFDEGGGIWYKFTGDTVKIRWKTSDQYSPWTSAEFGCNLIADGTIEFTYGNVNLNKIYSNIGGVSHGDKHSYLMTFMDKVPLQNTKVRIKTYPVPNGLSINNNGVLKGNLGDYYNYPIRVKVIDSNGIEYIRTYQLTTSIEEINYDANKIQLYPNPVNDFVRFITDIEFNDNAEISIYCMNGKLKVFKLINHSNGEILLNTSELKSGKYIYSIRINNKTHTGRFIKI